MRWTTAASVLGLLAVASSPRATAAAPPTIVSADARPFIQSHVAISKAYDPSRSIHQVAADDDTVDGRTAPTTNFNERVESYAEDPGGRTILLKPGQLGFDPMLPADATIGPFSGMSETTQSTTVAASAESVSVSSRARIRCGTTRIPHNALMGAFASGSASVGVSIQIARRCAYSFSATVSAGAAASASRGSGFVSFAGDDAQLPDKGRSESFLFDVNGRPFGPHPTTTRSMHLTGVVEPGFVSFNVSVDLTNTMAAANASWSATLHLSALQESDEIRWKAPRNGSALTASNWDPPRVPADDGAVRHETAVFDRRGTYVVDFATPTKALGPAQNVTRLRMVDAGDVTYRNADLTLTTDSAADPSVNVDGNTKFHLESSHLTSQRAVIGRRTGGFSQITLTGADSIWNCVLSMVVGGDGAASNGVLGAQLFVGQGAQLVTGVTTVGDARSGEILVDGATWTSGNVDVGVTEDGDVTVRNGATWTSGDVTIGQSTGGGSVAIERGSDGPATTWSAGDVVVGVGSYADLAVVHGAFASAQDVTVRRGKCIVDGPGPAPPQSSTLSCETLTIDGANAAVEATNGGVIRVIGPMSVLGSASVRAVLVSGVDANGLGSLLSVEGRVTDEFGLLSVEPGGRLTCESMALGSQQLFSRGVLAVSDGPGPNGSASCNVTGDLDVLGESSVILGPGTLTVGGNMVVAEGASLRGAGTIVVAGGLDLEGTIDAGLSFTNQPKRISPRAKPAPPVGATLTVDGNLVVGPTGVIRADAAGPRSARVVVTGDATLGGTLVLQFRDGFAPRAGDPFDVLEAAGVVVGDFASVDVRGLAPGAQFDLAKSGTTLTATAVADTVALPTVGVKASPAKLFEKTPKKKGSLTFTRAGDAATPLTVSYAFGGTAENGTDCTQLVGTVTFPAKKRSVKVAVEVAKDGDREDAETLEISVVPGADYTASRASTARFLIVDSSPRRRVRR